MEYQKIIILLDNAKNHPYKFRTRNWVEINKESRGNSIIVVALNVKLQW